MASWVKRLALTSTSLGAIAVAPQAEAAVVRVSGHPVSGAAPAGDPGLPGGHAGAQRQGQLLQRRGDGVRLLAMPYHQAVADPQGAAAMVNDFLGGNLDEAAMAAGIRPELHRQREQEKCALPE